MNSEYEKSVKNYKNKRFTYIVVAICLIAITIILFSGLPQLEFVSRIVPFVIVTAVLVWLGFALLRLSLSLSLYMVNSCNPEKFKYLYTSLASNNQQGMNFMEAQYYLGIGEFEKSLDLLNRFPEQLQNKYLEFIAYNYFFLNDFSDLEQLIIETEKSYYKDFYIAYINSNFENALEELNKLNKPQLRFHEMIKYAFYALTYQKLSNFDEAKIYMEKCNKLDHSTFISKMFGDY